MQDALIPSSPLRPRVTLYILFRLNAQFFFCIFSPTKQNAEQRNMLLDIFLVLNTVRK